MSRRQIGSKRAPHARGDGPDVAGRGPARTAFSPRAWGWSGIEGCRVGSDVVLPTRVGMVRTASDREVRRASCSPRAWGWSGMQTDAVDAPGRVLPTRVGMVRPAAYDADEQRSYPHARGDGPPGLARASVPHAGAPHARGDGPAAASAVTRRSRAPHARGDGPVTARAPMQRTKVLPTRVGMVRVREHVSACMFSPRAWGWSGQLHELVMRADRCSPRAWGWSGMGVRAHRRSAVLPTRVGMVRICDVQRRGSDVLPTRVGMVRLTPASTASRWRAPHARGDGPSTRHGRDRQLCVLPTRVGMVRLPMLAGSSLARVSPRAWGWSVDSCAGTTLHTVLPTRVGMVRNRLATDRRPRRAPHARGDGPVQRVEVELRRRSPHARGDGPPGSMSVPAAEVLPTRVGMVRDQHVKRLRRQSVLPTRVGMVRLARSRAAA